MGALPHLAYLQKSREGALEGLWALERYLRQSGINPRLRALVNARASQINGCACCVEMHMKDARVNGETERRLCTLSVWRETTFFSPRERAALEWTEALTRLSDVDVTDHLYERVRDQFDESALIDLTLAIVAINGWNRLAVPFRGGSGQCHSLFENAAAFSDERADSPIGAPHPSPA